MKRGPVALPYVTAPTTAVHPGEWHVRLASGESVQLPSALDGWDYMCDIDVHRPVTVDIGELRRGCGLAPEARLACMARWYSPGTQLRDVGCVHSLPEDGEVALELGMRIPGTSVATCVDLVTCIVLQADQKTTSPVVAHRAGSRLWDDAFRVHVEGRATRFPIQAVDFSASAVVPSNGAAWFLQWSPHNPEAPYLQSVLLYVNSAHPVIRRSLTDGDRLAWSVIYADVGRQLITGALRCEDFPTTEERLDADSVGYAVHQLIRTCFPGRSFEELRTEMTHDPSAFDAIIQGILGLTYE